MLPHYTTVPGTIGAGCTVVSRSGHDPNAFCVRVNGMLGSERQTSAERGWQDVQIPQEGKS
jgi:hypothetical protein